MTRGMEIWADTYGISRDRIDELVQPGGRMKLDTHLQLWGYAETRGEANFIVNLDSGNGGKTNSIYVVVHQNGEAVLRSELPCNMKFELRDLYGGIMDAFHELSKWFSIPNGRVSMIVYG